MKMTYLTHCVLIGLLSTLLLTASATASPLSDARDAGAVKELPTGFVTSQGIVSADINKLVKDVNTRRRAAYQKIAKKNKLTVEQVGRESYAKRYP